MKEDYMSDTSNKSPEQFWDNLYNERNRIWSGNANAPLTKATAGLAPGTALDLGCGEGGDAVWLAKQGWRVTAVDISTVALNRTRELAKEHGVDRLIATEQYDFENDFPAKTYDLVSAQYLQSPLDFERHAVLQKATTAVSPGGTLIIVEHAAAPSWSDHKDFVFPVVQETLEALELNTAEWEIKQAEEIERETTSPDGKPATIKDNVIIVTRKAI